MKVADLLRDENPVCSQNETLSAAMVKMTQSRLGVVALTDDAGALVGVFTDGDLRRKLQTDGSGILEKTIREIGFSTDPITIGKFDLLNEAVRIFEKSQVDSIVVLDDGQPCGVLDIQDLVREGILGSDYL
jgi:transaldolase